MSKTKLVFIDNGFKEILSSNGTKQCVIDVSQKIASNAGDGFESNVSYYAFGKRWLGFVQSTDKESVIAEAENKTLTRAVK